MKRGSHPNSSSSAQPQDTNVNVLSQISTPMETMQLSGNSSLSALERAERTPSSSYSPGNNSSVRKYPSRSCQQNSLVASSLPVSRLHIHLLPNRCTLHHVRMSPCATRQEIPAITALAQIHPAPPTHCYMPPIHVKHSLHPHVCLVVLVNGSGGTRQQTMWMPSRLRRNCGAAVNPDLILTLILTVSLSLIQMLAFTFSSARPYLDPDLDSDPDPEP